MAKKFEIIGISLVVTDTSDSNKILLEMPKVDAFHNYSELEKSPEIVVIYDTDGTNLKTGALITFPLSECIDGDDVAFTKETFLEFVRNNLSSGGVAFGAETEVFLFGDGENHDATVDETSTPIDLPANIGWNVAPVGVGVVGTPQYTIEVSDDGVVWFDYAVVFTDVAYDDAVEDPFLTWKKMRIVHNSVTATAGTVKYVFNRK